MDNTQSTRNVSVIKDADNNSIVMILDLRCRYTETVSYTHLTLPTNSRV